MTRRWLLTAFLLLAAARAAWAAENLVANGSFEEEGRPKGTPAAWAAAGNRSVEQELTTDRGVVGRRSARLACTRFEGDTPDAHAMVCQTGHVAVRAGRWYRLSFQARAQGLRRGAVQVALVDTSGWRPAGLSDAFAPEREWRSFEIVFRAVADVAAATSRLQFWFPEAGTLWLDDVALVETEGVERWLPEVQATGVQNLLGNASFECGTAQWGGLSPGLPGWAAGLWRLEGETERGDCPHGEACLRIALAPDAAPVYALGWYEPVRQSVLRVLAANLGWVRAAPGEAFTLSAWLRADTEGVPAELVVREAEGRTHSRDVVVGRVWTRHAFPFSPGAAFFYVAVGLDLTGGKPERATLWVDAVQLERGPAATAFETRRPLEAFLLPEARDGLFLDPARGLTLTVRAWNDADTPQAAAGTVTLTDFFDRPVHTSGVDLRVPSRASAAQTLSGLLAGRTGFFRATLAGAGEEHGVRCATIEPVEGRPSPFGFNHAFPYEPLLRLAVRAGVATWRDWSAQWNVVEPEPGRLVFAAPDAQVDAIARAGGEPLVLLPFPAAGWSTSATPARLEAAGADAARIPRLPMAFAPKDPADFGRYVGRTVARYAPRGVRCFQVLNEPLYTDYALPRAFGYVLQDYLDLLEVARDAAKEANPACVVVGGIGAHPEAPWTRAFVEQGGAALVDVLDVHLYAPPRRAESYAETWIDLGALMARHGGRKPIWVTEWGCYADDDPAQRPFTAGDAAMNLARWPSERAQAEHVVAFAAVGLCHGVERFFLHAGVTGEVNGNDAGGVLFEHGGAPRKVYPAIAAFVRLLGGRPEVARMVGNARVVVCAFAGGRGAGRAVGLAWATDGQERRVRTTAAVAAYDVMGNLLPPGEAAVGASPVYVVATAGGVDAVLRAVGP